MASDDSMESCAFCDEFAQVHGPGSRIIWEDSTFLLVPTLGCFAAGYSLFLPRAHVSNFAQLPPRELADAAKHLEFFRNTIRAQFRQDVILAEHGDLACGRNRSMCEPHAHVHLVPCDPKSVRVAYETVGGAAPHTLRDLAQLSRWEAEPYIMCSPEPGSYMVWPGNGVFGSQFVRRVSSAIHGMPDSYDWGLFPFRDVMQATRLALAPQVARYAERKAG